MGYRTRVQRIQRKVSEQWYVNFPAALARAMEFNKGEVVEWVVRDNNTLTLRRSEAAAQRARRRAKTSIGGGGDR
ncbi:MAG: hypothetical protein JSV19_11360 [Phycisphaerales bacterium]|nr:MAG: hypothetical protein JSV19_11360 [Phycisphaerales bacterium]